MKAYTSPRLFFLNLRLEERSAICNCTGCCSYEEAREYNEWKGLKPGDYGYLIALNGST